MRRADKYHLNRETGEVGPCNANVKDCPVGGPGDHFADPELAHASYAEQNKVDVFASLKKDAEYIPSTVDLSGENYPFYKNEDEEEFWEEMREKIGTMVYNSTELAVQPDDGISSSQYCTSCNHPVEKTNETEKCSQCGHGLKGVWDTGALVRRDNLKYFDDDVVRESTWYHTTQRENWADSLNESDRGFIHLGTEQCAKDRTGKTLRQDPDMPVYIYEIELGPDTQIHDRVTYEDPYQDKELSVNSNPKDFSDVCFDGATRYVNEMEDPGSISLVVNPKCIKVKNVRILNK